MDRTIQPEALQMKHFDLIKPETNIFSNGVPISIINIGEQEVVRLDIMFKGGRWRQSQKLQSIFTNRMLKEGTIQYASSEIAEKLDYYGAWLELSSSSEYEFITLYSLNKYFDETLKIIESLIKEPTFPHKELDVVINANIQQFLINQSKVDFISQRFLLNALYGDKHPSGSLIVKADYEKISSELLKEFHSKYYNSDDCAIFLSGKITSTIVSSVEKTFGSAAFGNCSNTSFDLPTYPITISGEKRIFIEQKDSAQNSVKLGLHTIDKLNPDYLKYRILIKLFGGYFGSRLMANIREEKGFTYGISAHSISYPDSGILMIGAETDSQYTELLIDEVYTEIDKLHFDLVSEKELNMVKSYMIGEMCRNYESPFSLSDAWIFVYTSGVNHDYYSKSLQAIQEVTSEDIRLLANRYLCKEALKEIVVGKK